MYRRQWKYALLLARSIRIGSNRLSKLVDKYIVFVTQFIAAYVERGALNIDRKKKVENIIPDKTPGSISFRDVGVAVGENRFGV